MKTSTKIIVSFFSLIFLSISVTIIVFGIKYRTESNEIQNNTIDLELKPYSHLCIDGDVYVKYENANVNKAQLEVYNEEKSIMDCEVKNDTLFVKLENGKETGSRLILKNNRIESVKLKNRAGLRLIGIKTQSLKIVADSSEMSLRKSEVRELHSVLNKSELTVRESDIDTAKANLINKSYYRVHSSTIHFVDADLKQTSIMYLGRSVESLKLLADKTSGVDKLRIR